jgi:hypothetical protein
MKESPIKIKLHISNAEIELECALEEMSEVLKFIPELISILSNNAKSIPKSLTPVLNKSDISNDIPDISVSKSDSLTTILIKLFSSSWSSSPKKLNEIREALNSYGLIYPKQSVAVTLLRMAQSGKLRRFKSSSGEYVYTPSTSLFSTSNSLVSNSLNISSKSA